MLAGGGRQAPQWLAAGAAVTALRVLLQKAREWGFPLYIASLDVAQAFDQVEACAAERALREHGATPWAIAAVLRELLGQLSWPRVAGVATDSLVELGKGARHGGSGTPILWNYMVSAVTKPLVREWEHEPAIGWCPEFCPLPIGKEQQQAKRRAAYGPGAPWAPTPPGNPATPLGRQVLAPPKAAATPYVELRPETHCGDRPRWLWLARGNLWL